MIEDKNVWEGTSISKSKLTDVKVLSQRQEKGWLLKELGNETNKQTKISEFGAWGETDEITQDEVEKKVKANHAGFFIS